MTRKRVIKRVIKKRKTIKKNKRCSKKYTFRKVGGASSSEKRLTRKSASQDSLFLPSLTPEEKSESSELPSLSKEEEEEEKEEEVSLVVPSLSPEEEEQEKKEDEVSIVVPSLTPQEEDERKKSFLIRPKTLKKKLITDLKSSAVVKQQQSAAMPRLNESFIDILDQLSSVMLKQGELFRAKAYQKAQETITSYPSDITNVSQLKGLPGIGPTITEKLNEYVSTGTLQVLEREKANPLHLLSDVYGIGPKKAKDLIEKGVTTIDQLRQRQNELLNDTQKVGLKYYEDILERIPRKEIDDFNALFKEVFDKVADSTSSYEIVGSYRRGAATSGDIDVIITSTKSDVFVKFMDSLLEKGIILEVLSRGPTKSLVIAKLVNGSHARRVDFLYTKPNEYPFSLLYFTGSKLFNTVMRGHALKLDYSLNEHGLSIMNGKVKGELVSQQFSSEKDIFDFLNMDYKTPQERIDGRSVIIKAEKESTFITQADETASVINSVVGSMINEPAAAAAVAEEKETIMIKVKKNSTRKKKTKAVLTEEEPVAMEKADIPSYIEQFKKEGISVVDQLTEEELSGMIAKANSDYYNFVPSMSDNEYDILKELMEKKYPSNPILKEVGAPVEVIKNKATLPYEMASMDKIKPDSGALGSWKKKYTGPYVLSGKADGVSGLYTTEGAVAKLYTRGNGIVGQDVSHLIPYLNLPVKKGVVVRGEFILPKKVFQEK
jgi:DNA polymerase/3'-5' exonuclease PolX